MFGSGRRSFRMLTWIMAGILSLAAPAPKDKPAGSVLGEWEAESLRSDGQTFPQAAGEIVMIFQWDGKRVTTSRRANTALGPEEKYVIHAGAVPAGIDLVEMSEINGRQVMRGIYKVDQDSLVICYDSDRAGQRPTGFDAPAKGSSHVLIMLRRVKPKD
jgi:uncharacterized protein (TIGR03067 family)